MLRASGGKNESSQNHDLSSSVDVRAAERYMYNQRRALINESTVIKMSFNQTGKIGAMFFHYNFGDEIEYIGYAYEEGGRHPHGEMRTRHEGTIHCIEWQMYRAETCFTGRCVTSLTSSAKPTVFESMYCSVISMRTGELSPLRSRTAR